MVWHGMHSPTQLYPWRHLIGFVWNDMGWSIQSYVRVLLSGFWNIIDIIYSTINNVKCHGLRPCAGALAIIYMD